MISRFFPVLKSYHPFIFKGTNNTKNLWKCFKSYGILMNVPLSSNLSKFNFLFFPASRWTTKSLISKFSSNTCFKLCISYCFSLSTALAESHICWYTHCIFILVQFTVFLNFPCDISSLTHSWFRTMLLNFHIFGDSIATFQLFFSF